MSGTTKRLEILKASLEKKEQLFAQKLQAHMDDVKRANGQPLNDKRNGRATLNRWEKQEEALRNIRKSIDSTKQAIETEQWKIDRVASVKDDIHPEILKLVESGVLVQWRKYPNRFFVKGVDRARIIWDKKDGLCRQYTSQIPNNEQFQIFKEVYNGLVATICPNTDKQSS